MKDKEFSCRLREILGPARLLEAPEERALYAVDGLIPPWVAFPENREEAGRLVSLAWEESLSIIPRGGGTKMGLGNPPRRADLVIATVHLDRLVDLDGENLTITVEAGARLADLQGRLSREGGGYFIPLDPIGGPATLGGILAADSSGPKRLSYGTARDLVLGMKILSAEGKIISCGGKTVKNVSGYDLCKLHIGALGTLGIIIEATLRLRPFPEREELLILPCRDVAQAWAAASRILQSELLPSSLLLLNGPAAAALPSSPPATAGHPIFLVGLEGAGEAVKAQIEKIRHLAQKEGILALQLLPDALRDRAWKALAGLPGHAPSVSLKITVPLSRGADLFRRAESISAGRSLPAIVVGQLGTGVLQIHFGGEKMDRERSEETAGAVEALRREAEEAGGSLIIQSAPLDLKARIPVWGRPGPSFRYMQALKSALDPKGQLNPGRFYGGL